MRILSLILLFVCTVFAYDEMTTGERLAELMRGLAIMSVPFVIIIGGTLLIVIIVKVIQAASNITTTAVRSNNEERMTPKEKREALLKALEE